MKLQGSDNLLINEETLPIVSQLAESIPGGFFIYHADGNQELIYFNSHLPEIFGCDDDEDFKKLVGNSFKGIVHPDDYSENESKIFGQIEESGKSNDHVRYRFIRKDGSVGMMDDYGHFSRSESFGDIFYVFVQDITKEYQEEQKAAQMELMRGIIDYDGVFLIDCLNDTRRTFHDRLSGAEHYNDEETYSKGFARYVENFVCGPDYEMMKEFIEPANILKVLGDRKELSITYRDKTTGTQRFYEMKFIRFSDTEVLQSFRENDAEVVNNLLFEKLEENYFALFVVDLESGLLRSYKDDPLHVIGDEGTISSLQTVMHNLALYCDDNPRAKRFFEINSDIKLIKKRFEKENRSGYIFRSMEDETKWVDVTRIVFSRNEDGTPSLLCFAFSFLDERSAELQETREKLQEALEEAKEANDSIAKQQWLAGQAEQARREQIAKTAGNESTYIVNPITERFQIISQNEHLSENYTAEEDFNTSFSRYIENDVFGPDKEMVKNAISIKAMVEHLNTNEEYIVHYRDISKGNPRWYEMRAVRLSDDEILYGFSDKDEEIITQIMSDNFRGNYFGLYYINIDSGLAQIIKTGHPEITGEMGEYVPYSELMKSIASESDGEAAEFFNKISDIDYIKNRFAVEDYAYHVYKSHIFEGNRWVNYTGSVLQRHEDGTPSIFALALSLLDDEASEKEEARVKLKESQGMLEEQLKTIIESNRVIEALSNDFTCVMYVENRHNKMEDLGVEVRVSERLKKAIPEWDSTDVFAKKLDMVLEHLVYEDDKEKFFIGTRREMVLENLERSDNYYLNTRFFIEGEIRYYQVQFAAVRENEELIGYVAGLHSIDEQMRQEIKTQEYLEEARIAAESSNRAKTNFLFNMSHDIRTPMNAITGFTQMAKKNVENKEKVEEYLDKIDASGQQLLTLINQVLEMSRIESGKIEFEEVPVDVQKEFNSAVTVLAEQAKANGLEFNYSLSNVFHNHVLADVARMSSITLNITGNALKYTPKGGRIDYILKELPERKKGYATYVFSVEDTGIGMSEEYQKILFEPFTRESNSTVSRIQGTGLGMSIVKSLVDMMDGDIEVKSEPGKGTRFDITIDFKIDKEADMSAYRFEGYKVAASFEGKRALLVEDNEMNREIALDILSEEDLLVDEAEDGSIAVDMLREKGPDYYDFILMDIQMPMMNGYEATKEIRKMYPDKHIPIIAVSANAFEEDKKASIDAGMDDHVAKPIKINELLEVLAKFI